MRFAAAKPPFSRLIAPVCALTRNPPEVSTALFEIMTPNVEVTDCPLGTNIFTLVSSTVFPPTLAAAHLPLFARSSHAFVRPLLKRSVERRTILPLPPTGSTPGFTPGPITLAGRNGAFTAPLTAHVPPTPIHASCPLSDALAYPLKSVT